MFPVPIEQRRQIGLTIGVAVKHEHRIGSQLGENRSQSAAGAQWRLLLGISQTQAAVFVAKTAQPGKPHAEAAG